MCVKRIATFQLLAVAVPLLCFSAVDAATAAIVTLNQSAVVTTPVIRLEDIADVVDSDEKRVTKLQAIVLVPSPAPGRQVRIGFAEIRSRIEACGVSLANVEFAGHSVVLVTADDPSAHPEGALREKTFRVARWKHERARRLVSEAIQEYLRHRTPELGKAKIVIRIDKQDVLRILKGAVSGFDIQGGQAPWTGSQTFKVRFLVQNEVVEQVDVRCMISEQPRIVAVKYTVPRGHVLRASDLVFRQTAQPAAGFTSLDEVVNKEAQRTIRRDEPITREDIRTVPLVRANDIVTVHARLPGLNVKRQLKAKSDGAAGDTITLVTLDRRETVLARVTGYHEAEVIGSGSGPATRLPDRKRRIQFRRTSAGNADRSDPASKRRVLLEK
jgi:flagella basal body P-ring formation protein FlgA